MTGLKRVSFFKDGDVNFSGVSLTITERKFRTYEQLVTELNKKVPLTNGVRTITTPMGFHKIRDVDELENGKKYICSSNKRIKRLDYENISKKSDFKVPRRPLSKNDYQPFKNKDGLFKSRKKIKKLNLISKLNSNNIVGIVLTNRVTDLEEVINDASEAFGYQVTSLFTLQGKKITSLYDLFSGGDTYIADIHATISSLDNLPLPFKSSSAPGLKTNGPSLNNASKLTSTSKVEETALPVDRKETLWLITIRTSNVPDASSDHSVYITLYGSHGNTGKFKLGLPLHTKMYYQDTVNETEIMLKDVGSLYKLRIGHEENGTAVGWHLDYVLLTNLMSNKEYLFNCNRWLSREKGDGEVERELPLFKNGKLRFSVHQYAVKIHNGQKENGCTNNDVYIKVEGENGDTGNRLLNIKDRVQAFRSGNVSIFEIEAVDLGILKSITIWLDHQVDDKDWFVEQVIVEDLTSDKIYYFPVKRKLVKGKSKIQIKPQNNAKTEIEVVEESSKIEEQNEIELSLIQNTSDQKDPKNKKKLKKKLSKQNKKNEENETHEESSSEYRIARHLQSVCEVVLISKLSGKSLCYNRKKSKLHASGEENFCCRWLILDVNNVSTKHLFSTFSNGYISMDDSNVTFNLGSPGLLNEFLLIISDDNTCIFESVVHNGSYLRSDENGNISITTDVTSDSAKFQCFMKDVIRDKMEVQLISHYDGSLLADVSSKPAFVIEDNKNDEKSTFVISTFNDSNSSSMITLKNKESDNLIVVKNNSAVILKKTNPSDIQCRLKFHKNGDIFQFESTSVPNQYLSKDEKTSQLVSTSNSKTVNAKFILKVLKGGDFIPFDLEESCNVQDAHDDDDAHDGEHSDSQYEGEDDALLYRDENYFSPISESSQSNSSDDGSETENEDNGKQGANDEENNKSLDQGDEVSSDNEIQKQSADESEERSLTNNGDDESTKFTNIDEKSNVEESNQSSDKNNDEENGRSTPQNNKVNQDTLDDESDDENENINVSSEEESTRIDHTNNEDINNDETYKKNENDDAEGKNNESELNNNEEESFMDPTVEDLAGSIVLFIVNEVLNDIKDINKSFEITDNNFLSSKDDNENFENPIESIARGIVQSVFDFAVNSVTGIDSVDYENKENNQNQVYDFAMEDVARDIIINLADDVITNSDVEEEEHKE
ncbi:protein PFC0760c isoform X2 [Hydra vulgaris]|uniref:Protein PFC0760c isoform X2 n=1 Tax=Hydra vulgaris TaxID=6087 RepID=A0ABM4BYG9_HYDVU